MKQNSLSLFFLTMSWAASAQKFPNLRYEDATYEPAIQTVAVYPQPNNPADPARTLLPPVANLDAELPLMAEFDDLTAQFRK